MPLKRPFYALALFVLGALFLVGQPYSAQGQEPREPGSGEKVRPEPSHQYSQRVCDGRAWLDDLRQQLERARLETQSRIKEARVALEESEAALQIGRAHV